MYVCVFIYDWSGYEIILATNPIILLSLDMSLKWIENTEMDCMMVLRVLPFTFTMFSESRHGKTCLKIYGHHPPSNIENWENWENLLRKLGKLRKLFSVQEAYPCPSAVQYFKRSTMYFVLKYPLKCSEVCFEVQRSAYFAALGLHCRWTWALTLSFLYDNGKDVF